MVNTKWIDAHLGLILRASRSRSQSLPPQHVCWARLGARNAFKMWIDAHIGVILMIVTFRRWHPKMKGALLRCGSTACTPSLRPARLMREFIDYKTSLITD